MKKLLSLLFLFGFTVNAFAASKMFEGKKVDQIKPVFIEIFTDKNWEVDQDSNTRLVLSKEIDGGSGFAIGLLNNLVNTPSNSASGSNPRSEISFTFVQKDNGVNVISNLAMLLPLSNGNVQKQRLDGDGEVLPILNSIYDKIYGANIKNQTSSSQDQSFKMINGTPIVIIGSTSYSVMEHPKASVTEVTEGKIYEKVKESLKLGEPVSEQDAKTVIPIYLKNTDSTYNQGRIESISVKSGQFFIWCDKIDSNYPDNCALMRGLGGTIVNFDVFDKSKKPMTLVIRKFPPKQ